MQKNRLFAVAGILFVLVLAAGCRPGGAAQDAYVYRDGVYTGVSDGATTGYVQAKVFIAGDEILGIDVVEHDGTGLAKVYALYGGDRFTVLQESHDTLARRMMDAATWDVEAFTGATSTSDKVKEAVRRALDKALVDRPGTGVHFDGTFMGMSDRTARGWGLAWVTIKDGKITEIKLAGTQPRRDAEGQPVMDGWGNPTWALKDEAYPHPPYHEGKIAIARALVDSQGARVDTFTGATSSSRQWMQAVERAMEAARR
ncbi:MAG: FMN-binding protein [bacterium]|nr:FMN-binding protein [bacterium]